jgi:hypothetical protein
MHGPTNTKPTWIECAGTPGRRYQSTAIDRLSHRKAFVRLTHSYIMCNNYFLFLSKCCIFITEKNKKCLVLFREIITFYSGNCIKHFLGGLLWWYVGRRSWGRNNSMCRPHCLPHHLCTLLSWAHNTHLLSSICSERVARNGKYNVSANNNRRPQASEPPHDIIRSKPDVPNCCR